VPLTIEDFKEPKFVKQAERKPFGENTKDKFYATDDTNEVLNSRRYKDGTFPQQGYNVNDNTNEPIKQNVNSDEFSLRKN